jgi:CBS domain-containing protein
MVEHALAHLVVVRAERPVGVISTLDIAAALAGRTAA